MLILGIDPGSIRTGWGLIRKEGRKIHYVDSGVLSFKEKDFLARIPGMKEQIKQVLKQCQPDAISMESLIYVKSPTALIKLAQTRGVILSALSDKYSKKIFEYSPNYVKSQTVGHGHADKASVQKFLQMTLGKDNFKSDDESDALAIAICHALDGGKIPQKVRGGKGLKSALAHKVREL